MMMLSENWAIVRPDDLGAVVDPAGASRARRGHRRCGSVANTLWASTCDGS